MAVSYRGASNAAGQSAGTTGTAGTASVTPTLPASTASGDRVFMVQCASNTSATSPSNWNLLGTKDTVIGTGAVAAGGGLRYMTVYYRDYDGVWSMPAMALTSATNNSHWIGAVSVQKGTYDTWDTPTISTVGGSFNTLTTNYTDTSAASFTTHSNAFLIIGSCFNDNVTSSAAAVTQSGATFGTVTERCDGGTATGNDVAGKVHTCSVTTGASATITQTQTLSTGSQGETLFVEQTVTADPYHIESRVAANADDMYYWKNSGTPSVSNSANQNQAGCRTATTETDMGTQVRFLNIAIPQGATIVAATISGEPFSSLSSSGVNTKLRAIDADNPSTVSTTTGGFEAPPFTTASVNWDSIASTTAGVRYSTPDISTVIQELVDRGGWASGNAIVISWDDIDGRSTQTTGTYREWVSYNFVPASAPLLEIEWEAAAAGPYLGAVGTRLAGAAASTANIAIPSGVTTGDIILAFVYIENGTTITVSGMPTGFAEASNSPAVHGGGSNVRWRAYWKRQTAATGAGETTGTYDFTLSGSAAWRAGWAARYTGCIASGDPFDTTTSAGSAGSTAFPDTSLTTTVANTLLVWTGSSYDGYSCTQPTGFTKDAQGETGNLDTGMCLASKEQAAAGGTGTLSATTSSGTNSKAVWLAALKPPAGAAAVVARSRATTQVPIIRSSLY